MNVMFAKVDLIPCFVKRVQNCVMIWRHHKISKRLQVTQKALADWGAASNLFYTMGDTRLLSSLPWRKAFSDYIFNRNNQEKKGTNNNSPGYLWLSCASLGTWELPALSRIVVSSRRYRNLISRGANSLRPSLGCTCFRLDQLLASASWVSHILCLGIDLLRNPKFS